MLFPCVSFCFVLFLSHQASIPTGALFFPCVSWEKEREVSVYVKGDLLWGVGSCDYGGWWVPQSSICELKIQESWWWNSHSIWRPENQGELMALILNWGQKKTRWDVPAQAVRQEKRGKSLKFLLPPSFVLFKPSMDWMMLLQPLQPWRGQSIFLSHSLSVSLTDTPRNKVSICAPSPVKLMHEINHYIYPPPTFYYY